MSPVEGLAAPPAGRQTLVSAPSTVEPAHLAKSLLEPRVVAYGSEVVVPARLLAERRVQLDGPPEVAERLVAGVARERREARVVVVEARVVRHVLEATADRFDRVGIALLAVGGHRVSMERPRVTPVERLVRLAGCGAEGEDGSVATPAGRTRTSLRARRPSRRPPRTSPSRRARCTAPLGPTPPRRAR